MNDACRDIRDDFIDRNEALLLMQKYDGEFQKNTFKEFLDYINITEEKYWTIIDKARPPHLGKKDGKWYLKKVVWMEKYLIVKLLRIISRLDLKFDKVIKGIHLEGWKKYGDANELCKKYYEQGVDEIILDPAASLYNRDKTVEILEKSARNLFIPIAAGGGIKNMADAEELFRSGADKITINSAAIKEPKIINEISKNFGSQSLSNFNSQRDREMIGIYILMLEEKKLRLKYAIG